MTTISVLLPIYNAQHWLERALSSVLSQQDGSLEIIAIDDGSTDRSAEIVSRAAALTKGVRLVQNDQNLGIIASLNKGLAMARGQFIARMDADDICMQGRFARQCAYLQQTKLDLCGTWFVEFGQGLPRTVRWPSSEMSLKAAMLFQNTICHPTVMARREVFEQLQYRESYRMVEDYDLFSRALETFRLGNMPEPLLRYRRHLGQATQKYRDAMEPVNARIRMQTLRLQGIEPSPEELRFHNLIRAPYSIQSRSDLDGIEAWLVKLQALYPSPEAKKVIASQWIRACIRAAPLGLTMWRAFKDSNPNLTTYSKKLASVDLFTLAMMRLKYQSQAFSFLRRLGVSN